MSRKRCRQSGEEEISAKLVAVGSGEGRNGSDNICSSVAGKTLQSLKVPMCREYEDICKYVGWSNPLRPAIQKYHMWMRSEDLQKLTASEPLTLEEEFQMQISWREDEDKCTFIILDKLLYEEENNEIECMVGDTNIFITDKETLTGEIEIMIAEESARGKKLGWEAVILMLLYGIQHIGIQLFEAKISQSNMISINMFHKLGFKEKSRSEIFQELCLGMEVSKKLTEWLSKQVEFKINSF